MMGESQSLTSRAPARCAGQKSRCRRHELIDAYATFAVFGMLDIPVLHNRLDQRCGKADIDDLQLAAPLASLEHRSKNALGRRFALDCHAPGLGRKLLRLHEDESKPW